MRWFHNMGFVACATMLLMSVPVSSCFSADEPETTNIVMTVSEMCGGCVKRITERFDEEKGVSKVVCSVEKKSVTLIPVKGVQLSPKSVWEIMEGIGKTPVKMISPDGTFTSKPDQ